MIKILAAIAVITAYLATTGDTWVLAFVAGFFAGCFGMMGEMWSRT